MGWMNDSLRYLKRDPFFRQYHHDDITFAMVYHYSENYILPISHDEVVHGKLPMIYKAPLDAAGQFASLRAFYGYMWTFPGKKLLFMGCEFGQRREWDEKVSLQWELLDVPEHRGVQALVRDLNAAYRAHPALWRLDDDREGFAWLDVADREHNTFSWLRRDDAGEQLACAVNFSPVAWTDYQLALPAAGLWTEVLNTDAVAYGGSGMVTAEPIVAEPEPYLEYPASAVVTLPPLSAVIWRYSGTAPQAMGQASE
jgi:1,4-alpha-glucan branching enzyme